MPGPMSRRIIFCTTAALALAGSVVGAAAVPSLKGTDRDEIPVVIDGVKTSVLVIRDADQSEQWYYIPDTPRVAEVKSSAGTAPQLALVRYQYPDPDHPGELLEKGLVQFAVSIALPQEALEQVRAALRRKVEATEGKPKAETVKLSALPIKSATVDVYNPANELIVGQPAGSGLAPQFSTQKIGLSIALSKIGAPVVNELIRGRTGLFVRVKYTYVGKLPPAGFKVRVDRKQLFHHYSDQTKIAASVSYLGLYSASYNKEDASIVEELRKSNIVEVIREPGESMSDAEIDAYLPAIIKQVNDELLQPLAPPPKVDPAHAADPGGGGRFVSGGYSRATKTVDINNLTTFEWDFKGVKTIDQDTLAGGFIGIGKYSAAVQDGAVTVVPAGPPTAAVFLPPQVGDVYGDLRQADVTIRLINADGSRGNQQIMTWSPDKKTWTDIRGRAVTSLAIPILAQAQNPKELAKTRFEVQTRLNTRLQSVSFTEIVPASSGETNLVTPQAGITEFTIEPAALSWQKFDPTSKLIAVTANFTTGTAQKSFRMAPTGANPPDPIVYLMPVGADTATERTSVKVAEVFSDGRTRIVYDGPVLDIPSFPMLVLTNP